jgi:nitroreductase
MLTIMTYLLLMLSLMPLTAAFAPPRSLSRRSFTPESLSAVLTSEQERAREVFSQFDANGSGTISSGELADMLRVLDIEATDEESDALFKYLDEDGDDEVCFDEFFPWYSQAADTAKEVATSFQSLLVGRRTVEKFDQTAVSDDVLKRAVECAIAAPNRSMSEPWRFIKIGPETVQKFSKLNTKMQKNMETDLGQSSVLDWTTIPGWCVVTTKLSPNDPDEELEDFKSTSCAVQNFMLSMWSEGIGTKWTSGPVQRTQEFAELCGVDATKERVAGCIWYGFATGGLTNADPKRRKKGVDDVLSSLP